MRRIGSKVNRDNAWSSSGADHDTVAGPSTAITSTAPPPPPSSSSSSYVPQSTPLTESAETFYASSSFGKSRKLEPLGERMFDEEVQLYLEMARQQLGQDAGGAGPYHTRTNPPSVDASSVVDMAVHETLRVLKTCWAFVGRPQDAFEPVRCLSPITRHLLLTYGHHRLTSDGQYVVLNGGEETMPYVGLLMDCLYRQMQRSQASHDGDGVGGTKAWATQSPFRASYHAPLASVTGPATAGDDSTAPPSRVSAVTSPSTSRLLLANCHSFGWMDSLADVGYEESSRALQQMNGTLKSLALDEAYMHVGRPRVLGAEASSSSTSPASSLSAWATVSDLPSQTVILLADTVLMDGGVPSLHLAKHGAAVFAAHHQYGRGLACLVPALPPAHTPSDAPSQQPSASASPAPAPVDSRGLFVHASRLPPITTATTTPMSLPPLAGAWWDRAELPPLSCGTRSVPGAATAQAVLLSPVGPLIMHVQYQVDSANSEFARLFAGQRQTPTRCAPARDESRAADRTGTPLTSQGSPGGGLGSAFAVHDVTDTTVFDARSGWPCEGSPYSSSGSSVVQFASPTAPTRPPSTHAAFSPFGAAAEEEERSQEEQAHAKPTALAEEEGQDSSPVCHTPMSSPTAPRTVSQHTTTFSIDDLPYVLYLAASGNALTSADVTTAAAAAAAAATAGTGTSVAFQDPSSLPTHPSPSRLAQGRGPVWPESRVLTLMSQLSELTEWLLQLLRSPVPVVLVEWQLDPTRQNATGTAPHFGMISGPPRPSLTMQLLQAYTEGRCERAARQAACAAPHASSASYSFAAAAPPSPALASQRVRSLGPARDGEDPLLGVRGGRCSPARPGLDSTPPMTFERSLQDVVRDVIAHLARCPEVAPFDGQERPLVFVRGLETAAETERFANPTTVVTSVQYRRRSTSY